MNEREELCFPSIIQRPIVGLYIRRYETSVIFKWDFFPFRFAINVSNNWRVHSSFISCWLYYVWLIIWFLITCNSRVSFLNTLCDLESNFKTFFFKLNWYFCFVVIKRKYGNETKAFFTESCLVFDLSRIWSIFQ